MESNKPPVQVPPVQTPPLAVPQPPVQAAPRYPEVFVNSRWRLAVIGGIGLVGILASTAILAAPDTGGGSRIGMFAILVGFFSILVFYGLLQLLAKWTLYEDRLEFRNFLGMQRTIRRLDVLDYSPDWTGIRWCLRNAHTKIPVGWELSRWGYLSDVLKTWAPRN